MLHIGFTGTERGMTRRQKNIVRWLLGYYVQKCGVIATHHGDCIGADKDFHDLTEPDFFLRHIHPPIKDHKRAFCTGPAIIHKPMEYLDRDFQIALFSAILIACPENRYETTRRGPDAGTWFTIRQARKRKKSIIIVWP